MLTQQQLIERRHYVGGSDVPIILGLSQYTSPLDLYNRKLELVPEQETNEMMELGNALERPLLDYYSKKHNVVVETGMDTYRGNKTHYAANVDGIAIKENKKVIIEVKTGAVYWKDGEVPALVEAQCQWQMYISGIDTCVVIAYIGGRFKEYELQYNSDIIAMIIPQIDKFWQCVQDRTQPPATTLADWENLYSNTQDIVIQADDEILDKTHSLKRIRDEISRLIEHKETLELDIKLFMQDNNTLAFGEHTLITNKVQIANRLDTALLKTELPDIYKKYTKQSQSTVFRVKKDK